VDLVDALFGPRELLQLPDPGRSIVRWSDLGPAAVWNYGVPVIQYSGVPSGHLRWPPRYNRSYV